MLMYGTSEYIKTVSNDNTVILNLTSFKEGLPRLQSLIPPNNLGLLSGKEFDIAYANYIMSNDNVFLQFYDIIYLLYCGKDVYLTISNDDWSEDLVESLFKLIQQRYGYNGNRINSIEDYYFECNRNSDFDPRLLINLDSDKERYSMIVQYLNMKRN